MRYIIRYRYSSYRYRTGLVACLVDAPTHRVLLLFDSLYLDYASASATVQYYRTWYRLIEVVLVLVLPYLVSGSQRAAWTGVVLPCSTYHGDGAYGVVRSGESALDGNGAALLRER